ncbi:Choline/Carnitine o-acyltransferase-domain-containing protein [Leucosporidium creatinivorum]|uniref:Nucleolar GTP-binding protein 2 n=1 Tax=Leucosporidium creatinivorum TaxID=106004 RepID=A0A1Y2E658_9BASI|nr:Choline/Carnitine o-acyltransferase-domain-containing protein [Leucosporidium creatinivorum]
MVRDTSNKETKKRNSKHAAATGLKTGNLKTKGENFYRDAKQVRRVNMLSGKSGSAVRDKDGKITQEAEFQSKEVTPGRVQPDRRWFGNTRTISQTALEHFRTSLKEKIADPYSVVLKKNKLPMSLLTDLPVGKAKMDLTTTEPFSDTFGSKAQRKRPRLDVGSFSELANKVTAHQASKKAAATLAAADALLEAEDTEESRAPEDVRAEAAEGQLSNVPMDYILSAGTSRRIWGELYKVIDSSDLLLHVLDARDPMGTRCESVEAYLAKEKRGKKVVYILNKVDLVPGWVAARWVKVLSKTHPTIAFHASINNSFGKGSLIQLLRQFSTLFSDKKQISVGFIGYPNVGKSSIINTLKKKAVCKTAPIPGETKVWQYITLMRRIYLIDCPGIVPPSARDSESQKVLKGVVRVEHLSSPSDHVALLLERVRPEYLTRTYGVSDWKDSDDFLGKLAAKMGKLHRGGEGDHRTVATMVLNDWIRGKIPYFVSPPEPDTRDANGKPLPRPLKIAGLTEGDKKKKTKGTGGTETLSGGTTVDAQGNTVKSIKGVTQPLHQIVHSNKFLADDNQKIDEDTDEEDDDDDEEEAAEEEWGGIAEDDIEADSDFEGDSFEGEMPDGDVPLQWDELFAQAVGEESGDEDVEVVMDAPGETPLPKLSAKAEGKKKRTVDEASEDDEEEEEETKGKEKRMTTNKKKATNFFTTANVKNKNRNRTLPTNTMAGKGKDRFEASLPSLPVPTLEETAARYLTSIKPFHTPQAPGSPSTPLPSFAASEAAVKEFQESALVQELQQRLEKRAAEKSSWLSEWWNETAYFGWRGPVVPGVNYFYVHKNDKTRTNGPARAAGLTRALLYFRKLTETQQLEPEMAKKTPLCMASYKYLFNATRLPTAPVDTARKYDPDTHNHVVVVRKNKFYEVPVVDEKGDWLSEKELEALFNQVVELAGYEADPYPVGALTAADRDVWTKARQQIVSHAPENAASLERIESAIIIISLDSTKPVTREETSWGLWVGDGKDRWFDKHQLVVFENGKSGFNGEHSCMDGTPTSRLNDWLLRSLEAGKVPLGDSARSLNALPSVTPLTFNLPHQVQSTITESIKVHDEVMAKHELAVLQYDGYGKDKIKTFKISPDSYTQLVMGLAYYKLSGGKIAPTYESAQTRKYKLGRTEVIRSATLEALEFYKAMVDASKTDSERLSLLQKAGAAHIKLAGEAADGRGVDRHLFGLKKLLKEGEKLPAIYADPTFAESGNWVLSTSQLTSEYFEGWGYAEVIDEGYGLAYAVNNASLRFTITSMLKGEQSVRNLRHYLEESATEMRGVMESGLAQQEKEKAKL